MPAIEVGEGLPTTVELRLWRRARNKRNLTNKNAGPRLRDAMHFAQTRENFLAGDDQQHAVANDDRRTCVRNGQPVAEGLLHIQPFGPNQGNFFLGRPQSQRTADPDFRGKMQQNSVSTTDVNEVVTRSEAHNVDDALMNCGSDLLFARAPQREVVQRLEVDGIFATVFDVIVGGIIGPPNLKSRGPGPTSARNGDSRLPVVKFLAA